MKTLLEIFENELDNIPNILNETQKTMRATAANTEKITITAVNKKHQKQVNKAVKALINYNNLNDLRNLAYDECDDKLTERFDRKCELAWDKYYDAIYDLPKRELDKIEKSILY